MEGDWCIHAMPISEPWSRAACVKISCIIGRGGRGLPNNSDIVWLSVEPILSRCCSAEFSVLKLIFMNKQNLEFEISGPFVN